MNRPGECDLPDVYHGLVGNITCLRFSAAKLTTGAMEIGGNSKYPIAGVGNVRPKM